MGENRGNHRKAVKSTVEFSDPEGHIVHGVGSLRDVSESGCRIETALKLPLNEAVRVSLFSSNSKTSMDIVATVLWKKDASGRKAYGLRFPELTDSDRAMLHELYADD